MSAQKLFKHMKNVSDFEAELSFEILKSELIRIRVLGVFFAIMIVPQFLFGYILPPEKSPLYHFLGIRFPFHETFAATVILLLYELAVDFGIRTVLRKKIRIPEMAKFGNALIETSIPTILFFLVSKGMAPAALFNSPLVFLYFFFIILSVLRLSLPLSLWTGIVAGVGMATAGYFLMPWRESHGEFSTSIVPVIVKSGVFVGLGFVAGFVANELRKRLVHSLQTTQERNRVASMFGQYLSPAVVDKLLSQKSEFSGELSEVTVMFLDIRNFTRFSESRSPGEVISYLNKLFGDLITIINRNGGMINKFLGDGFMAIFGAPEKGERDVENAVKAAMEIVAQVEAFNRQGAFPETRIGIGMHTGQVLTGNVGSEEKKEYTIIGDTVNLASRVEQLNKEFKSVLLVTSEVFERVKDNVKGEELPSVQVKGREASVRIFRVV